MNFSNILEKCEIRKFLVNEFSLAPEKLKQIRLNGEGGDCDGNFGSIRADYVDAKNGDEVTIDHEYFGHYFGLECRIFVWRSKEKLKL